MKRTIAREDIIKTLRVPLWRNRDYMLLWSGQTVSLVGTVISQTAFPLLVWDLTHSAAQVGLVGGLGTLPYVLLSLLAVWVTPPLDPKIGRGCWGAGRGLQPGSGLSGLISRPLTVFSRRLKP